MLDTETSYTYSDAYIDALTNASMQRIARESPFILTSGDLENLDGILYEFDLTAEFTGESQHDFHRLRAITPMGGSAVPLTLHQEGMSYIRRLEARSAIVAGVPIHYVGKGTSIVLDAIPAVDATITVDYWGVPVTLVLDADTPEGLLATGWDDLILGMNKIGAGNDIPGDEGDRLLTEGTFTVYGNRSRKIIGEMDKFKDWVIEDLGHFADEAAPEVSDIRGGGTPTRKVSEFAKSW